MFFSWNLSPRWLPQVNATPLGNFTVSKMNRMLARARTGPRKVALLVWIIYDDVWSSLLGSHSVFGHYLISVFQDVSVTWRNCEEGGGGMVDLMYVFVCFYCTGHWKSWNKEAQAGFHNTLRRIREVMHWLLNSARQETEEEEEKRTEWKLVCFCQRIAAFMCINKLLLGQKDSWSVSVTLKQSYYSTLITLHFITLSSVIHKLEYLHRFISNLYFWKKLYLWLTDNENLQLVSQN